MYAYGLKGYAVNERINVSREYKPKTVDNASVATKPYAYIFRYQSLRDVEFLATMSHEIRTPINAMIGYTDLLEIGVAGPLQERQQEYMERIRLSGQHLIAIVNDVLDFAKIESGQMRIAREVHDAPAAIHAAVSMFEGKLRARNTAVHCNCPYDAQYTGDSRRVQQILLNLLSNAVKFTEPGGNVTIHCERRESRSFATSPEGDRTARWLCISVADNGSGIPADQLSAIFEPFVQGTGGYTRPHGGTGLGLAISRSLARLMGGDLTVESEYGEGATFTLWLPQPSGAAVTQPA
jgi:signal transduction histidine kinase